MGCADSKRDQSFHKAPIKKDSKNNQFQMYAAIKSGKLSVVKEYLQSKFDINYKMPTFLARTPLHLAAEYGHIEIIRHLIANNAELESVDYSGCTPVFLAMKAGNIEAMNVLIEYGADIHRKTFHNMYLHDFISQSKAKESRLALKKAKYNNRKCISD